jgi:hypothetical protein
MRSSFDYSLMLVTTTALPAILAAHPPLLVSALYLAQLMGNTATPQPVTPDVRSVAQPARPMLQQNAAHHFPRRQYQ